MSVSSTNRQRHTPPGSGNGNANHLSAGPDAQPGADRAPDVNGNGSFAAPSARPDRHVNRLAEKTDEELLAAYRGGDRLSFAALVERYQRELFHFLVRFLGDRAAAEDIFQETFLQ